MTYLIITYFSVNMFIAGWICKEFDLRIKSVRIFWRELGQILFVSMFGIIILGAVRLFEYIEDTEWFSRLKFEYRLKFTDYHGGLNKEWIEINNKRFKNHKGWQRIKKKYKY